MEIDETGWIDLESRLRNSTQSAGDIDLLIDHLTARLVSHFGVEVFDCWLGKDGTSRHTAREVAAAAIAHLIPVLDALPPGSLEDPSIRAVLTADVPPPWDDHWSADPRTAHWRS